MWHYCRSRIFARPPCYYYSTGNYKSRQCGGYQLGKGIANFYQNKSVYNVETKKPKNRQQGNKNMKNTMSVDPCIVVQFIQKNPTSLQQFIRIYFSMFMWSSTCFGRHASHHKESKTALATSGFSYVEGCWICNWWTLSRPATSASNNLSRMQNQRLLVQF